MTRPTPPSRYQKTSKASASGGYGEIEIWHDNSLDRDVAIKWTKPENALQLLSEVRALSQNLSPYIVEIYDLVVTDDGQLRGIVLEYLTGHGLDLMDLTDISKTNDALAILYQMAKGLADFHAVGLVHRDVKPANAVCTGDGRLKLVDFGLTTPGTGAETLEARGTLAYAAPELFSPPPIPVTNAMDVYSFGVLCWKKLTGKYPIVGPFPIPDSTFYPLPSLGTKRALASKLVKLLDDALSWEPMKRPAMSDISDALLAELMNGRHTACVTLPGKAPNAINTDQKKVSTFNTAYGTIEIAYDGYRFWVKKVTGDVFINNFIASVGQALHSGCLLTFGNRTLGSARVHVPFRQSSPEVLF